MSCTMLGVDIAQIDKARRQTRARAAGGEQEGDKSALIRASGIQ